MPASKLREHVCNFVAKDASMALDMGEVDEHSDVLQVPQLTHALVHGDELAFGAAERDEVLAASFKAYGSPDGRSGWPARMAGQGGRSRSKALDSRYRELSRNVGVL